MKLSPYSVSPELFVTLKIPLPTSKNRLVFSSTDKPPPPIQMPPSPVFAPYCAMVLLGVVLKTELVSCSRLVALKPMIQP